MAYENDRHLYEAAITASVVAAGVLRAPKALEIPLLMATMYSDPGAMSKAAAEWAAPAVRERLVDLKNVVTTLVTDAEKKKDWGGKDDGNFQLFRTNSETFTKEIDKLIACRDGAGQCLDQTAGVYHCGAQICSAVGGWMTALLTLNLTGRFLPPPMQTAVTIATYKTLNAVHNVLSAIVKKKKTAVYVVLGIVGPLAYSQMSSARLFWGLTSFPGEDKAGDFQQTELKSRDGQLTNPNQPKTDLAGGLGGLGGGGMMGGALVPGVI
ncbi:hypothetical protein Misp01_01340 [Microtetraspora sp. NBRC 13810]|uniref:hypothetical protein n=1 Tax=Microtetraspora sp. NBRC 13810 TaxID=3030990 RepID=UPI0024A4C7EE|nr:hypothetical protein [Microtetraspora sp. NBRC 13810]GLW05004.1 hypothetical protein Misp01_01340 [Microtetraspora sp. NBRC 13810]